MWTANTVMVTRFCLSLITLPIRMSKKKNNQEEIDRIFQLANGPHIIQGIHNYCDRWCERCPLNEYCSLYATENERDGAAGNKNADNEEFWQQLSENFEMMKEMLHEGAEKWGIDLSGIEDESWKKEYEIKEKKKDEFVEKQEISKWAAEYRDKAKEWFEEGQPLFEQKQEELARNLEMGIREEDTIKAVHEVKDALEVINWYHYFIEAKITRALSSQFEEQEGDEMGVPRDADGSAKIGLIAVEKTMAAWASLMKHIEERTDDIIPLLALLEKLKNGLEAQFPNARKFIRPGFDEPDVVKKKKKILMKEETKSKRK